MSTVSSPRDIFWIKGWEKAPSHARAASKLEYRHYDRPALVMHVDEEAGIAEVLTLTTLRGKPIADLFNKERRKTLLPISPSPPHPLDQRGLLRYEAGFSTNEVSNVKIDELHTVVLDLLRLPWEGKLRLDVSSYNMICSKKRRLAIIDWLTRLADSTLAHDCKPPNDESMAFTTSTEEPSAVATAIDGASTPEHSPVIVSINDTISVAERVLTHTASACATEDKVGTTAAALQVEAQRSQGRLGMGLLKAVINGCNDLAVGMNKSFAALTGQLDEDTSKADAKQKNTAPVSAQPKAEPSQKLPDKQRKKSSLEPKRSTRIVTTTLDSFPEASRRITRKAGHPKADSDQVYYFYNFNSDSDSDIDIENPGFDEMVDDINFLSCYGPTEL